jgi:hypothetical protein
MMLVRITTAGVVDECTVLETSGSQILDKTACDHVTRVWRWEPPTSQGRPTNVLTRVSVTWALLDAPLSETDDLRPILATQTQPPLPDFATRPAEPGLMEMVVHITKAGAVDECAGVDKSISQRLIQAACEHVKRFWRWEPPTAKGQPSDASARIWTSWNKGGETPSGADFTVAATLVDCLSDNREIRLAKCDLPFGILYSVAAAATVNDSPMFCGLPRSGDAEKDRAAFKEKLLAWFRDHPETRDEHLAPAGRAAVRVIFACRL